MMGMERVVVEVVIVEGRKGKLEEEEDMVMCGGKSRAIMMIRMVVEMVKMVSGKKWGKNNDRVVKYGGR
jgi:hypothetical protein